MPTRVVANSGLAPARISPHYLSMAEAPPDDDLVLLRGPTEDGAGLRVLRARRGTVQAGEVRPLEEGKPIHGDVVALKPRAGSPAVCDVQVLHPSSEPHGPAQVATRSYRENWEATFGKPPAGAALN